METRFRLTDREIVLVGDPERALLEVFEEAGDGERRRRLGSLKLADASELAPLFAKLTDSSPVSDPGPPQPFQPPSDGGLSRPFQPPPAKKP